MVMRVFYSGELQHLSPFLDTSTTPGSVIADDENARDHRRRARPAWRCSWARGVSHRSSIAARWWCPW